MLFHWIIPRSPPGVVKDMEKAVEETSTVDATMDAPTEEEKAQPFPVYPARNRPFRSLMYLFKMVVFYMLPEAICLVLLIG